MVEGCYHLIFRSCLWQPLYFSFCARHEFYIYTSSEARLWWASVLRPAVDGLSVKVLWRQCFNESTSNVSYVDDKGNWSKVIPVATMWQCFRVIMCKAYACMHAYNDWTVHVYELVYASQLGLPANAMLVCRMQAEHFRSRCEGLLSRTNYQ